LRFLKIEIWHSPHQGAAALPYAGLPVLNGRFILNREYSL
jgi:hypothetical protein